MLLLINRSVPSLYSAHELMFTPSALQCAGAGPGLRELPDCGSAQQHRSSVVQPQQQHSSSSTALGRLLRTGTSVSSQQEMSPRTCKHIGPE